MGETSASSISLQTPLTVTPLTWLSSACPRNIDELIAHVHEAFLVLSLDICCKVWTTAQIVMHQILMHNGNNNYKHPHIGKLTIEKAVGGNISMRLPCQTLIDGGALDC